MKTISIEQFKEAKSTIGAIEYTDLPEEMQEKPEFKVGDKVMHLKYGKGKIIENDPAYGAPYLVKLKNKTPYSEWWSTEESLTLIPKKLNLPGGMQEKQVKFKVGDKGMHETGGKGKITYIGNMGDTCIFKSKAGFLQCVPLSCLTHCPKKPKLPIWTPDGGMECDKAPIVGWDHDLRRSYGFWDAKNKCMFSPYGKRALTRWNNYAPIKPDRWIRKMFKTLED